MDSNVVGVLIVLLVFIVGSNIYLWLKLIGLRNEKIVAAQKINTLQFKVVRLQEECKTWKDAATNHGHSKPHSTWRDE